MSRFCKRGESEGGVGRGGNLDSNIVATKELDRLAARMVESGEVVHLAVDGDVALHHKKRD